MELLLGFIIASIIGISMIVKLIFWVTDKSAGVAITSYFQAAEYILETHQPPMTWTNTPVPLSQRLFNRGKKKSSPDLSYLLRRMDELITFFEHSTFFQDEDARTALLEQLHNERSSWERRKLEHM